MGVEDHRTKRDAANERLRAGFLGQVGPQLLELRELLLADPGAAVRESVSHELIRTANTARSLQLEQLATVAAMAAEQVAGGGEAAVLRSVASAIRRAHGHALLAGVVVVARGPFAEKLTQQAQTASEPVRVVPAVDALFGGLVVDVPTALVVPAAEIDAVARLAEEPLPLIAYGDADVRGRPIEPTWNPRLAAARAGAEAFLPGGFDLEELLDVTRWLRERQDLPKPEVFVLMEDAPARDALLDALSAAGVATMASETPRELVTALDVVSPDALIVGASVADLPADTLLSVARAHAGWGDLPVLVVGDPDDAAALRSAGADDVLHADTPPEEVAQRVLARIARFTSTPSDRDRITRLPNRRGTLRLLDRNIANARRRSEPLTVVLLHIDHLEEARERYGRAAVNLAQRALGSLLEAGVRRVDVVGRLDPATFLVAFPSCRLDRALPRIHDLRKQFERRCRGDHSLKGLGLVFGVADSETTLERLVIRAQDDLYRAPR